MRLLSFLLLASTCLVLWTGCEAHIDAPPPRTVDVQVEPPPRVDVDVPPPRVDVDVTRKPGADVDVNVKR